MTKMRLWIGVLIWFLCGNILFAQNQDPRIGYVYPAGGQRGTSFQVMLGGRQIARSESVYVSGTGIEAKVLKTYSSMRINDSDSNRVARAYLDHISKNLIEGTKTPFPKSDREGDPEIEQLMQRHPFLDRLENPSQEDAQLVFYEHFSPRAERRAVESIGQGVLVEITIDENAEPGPRDLRLLTPYGYSPPVRLFVGLHPEVIEMEPNEPGLKSDSPPEFWGKTVNNAPPLKQLGTLDIPVTINGQVRAGDVDRFVFRAKKGQNLLIAVRARELNPFLADGVPGWFEAFLSLRDAAGNLLEEKAEYRFEPDPIIFFPVPSDGEYTLDIRDSIFRGRDDFAYRITIDESPFITAMHPIGRGKDKTVAKIEGWNLKSDKLVLEGGKNVQGVPIMPEVLAITELDGIPLPYPVRYSIDGNPRVSEKEPNDILKNAQNISIPTVIDGRIDIPEDVDCYMFEAEKGDEIVADVTARSLGLPLDATLELLDEKGTIIASNDDRAYSDGPNFGLETHHADPYIMHEIPKSGKYFVRIYSTLGNRGGPEYSYALRVSKPRPGFTVFAENSALNYITPVQPLNLRAIRFDGFDEEIRIMAEKDSGFRIDGGIVPRGCDRAVVTLGTPEDYDGSPCDVPVFASTLDGKNFVRNIVFGEMKEQAFIYHHLVPAESLLCVRITGRKSPGGAAAIHRSQDDEIRTLKANEKTYVVKLKLNPVRTAVREQARKQILERMIFNLYAPIETMQLDKSYLEGDELVFEISRTKNLNPGHKGNIVIEIVQKSNASNGRDVPLGVLPAIPFKIE